MYSRELYDLGLHDKIMKKSNNKKPRQKPIGPLTAEQALKKAERRLKKLEDQVNRQSVNPQALERQRQAKHLTAEAHKSRKAVEVAQKPKLKSLEVWAAWKQQQLHPQKGFSALPPFTNNDCQTTQTNPVAIRARAVYTVAAGTCRQISIFARGPQGKGGSTTQAALGGLYADIGSGDETAAHNRPLAYRYLAGATTASLDWLTAMPVPTTVELNVAAVVTAVTLQPSNVIVSQSPGGLIPGEATLECGLDSTVQWSVITPSSKPPYSAGHHGHVRAVTTGLSVTVLNTTSQSERGGDVVTVIPPSYVSDANLAAGPKASFGQGFFMKYPTYRVHPVDKIVDFVIPTREQDLVYSHIETNIASNGSSGLPTGADALAASCNRKMGNAAGLMWLNNPTANEQTYEICEYWNSCLGGELVASISEPSQPHLALKPAVVAAASSSTTNVTGIGEAFRGAEEHLVQVVKTASRGVREFSPMEVMKMVASNVPRIMN